MADFDEIAEKAVDAINRRDSQALHELSEKFLDLISIHYTTSEWKSFAASDAGFACLLGFELSHLHLGSEVGMTRQILGNIDSMLAKNARTLSLLYRWKLIGLPLEIVNIENDWKRCLHAIAAVLESAGNKEGGESEFEQALFERAGIVTFGMLKELMNQIAQSEALMGAVLTMKNVSNETQTMLATWMFSEPNAPCVPTGSENYMGPSGVSGSSPK